MLADAADQRPARRWVGEAAGLWLASRLMVLLVAYLAAGLLPPSTNPPPYHLRGTENVLVDAFGSRWDTGFYVSIVEEGYVLEGAALPSVAFFPLLPLLMRAALPVTGDAVLAGLLVSNLALLAAALLFFRLVADESGEDAAARATWYLLVFPTSFFGSAIYTESLFLATAIGALLAARRGRWAWAAVAGIACSLTRLHGLVVAPMLAIEWWQRRRRPRVGERPPAWGIVAALATPLGTGAYMAYCAYRFGNPLAFVEAAARWSRGPSAPLETLRRAFVEPATGWWRGLLAGQIHFDRWIDLVAVLAFLILGCLLIADRRWSEGVFVLAGLTLSISSGLLMSQRRYAWALFPVFALLGAWGHRPWIDRSVNALFLGLLALFTALFTRGYWVG